MSNASKFYLKAIYNHFSLLASWLPNTNVALGDVGVLEDGLFKQLTTLENLGIAIKIRSGASAVDFNLSSESDVRIQSGAKGEVASMTPLAAQANISIEFSRAGGFVFQAGDCYVDEVEDKVNLGKSILALFRIDQWDRQWVVVDSLVRAGSATIVISNSSKASLELSANSPIEASSLARISSSFSVSSQTGDIVRFISQPGLTPLFKLSRVKQSMLARAFGTGSVRFAGASRSELAEADFFEPAEPGYSEV
jgi:hypothetical protein